MAMRYPGKDWLREVKSTIEELFRRRLTSTIILIASWSPGFYDSGV
jgi:hypothetical protein